MKNFLLVIFLLASNHLYSQNDRAESANASRPLSLSIEPHVMEAPSFKGQVLAVQTKIKPVKLTLVSATKNNITDEAEWLKKNDLALPGYEVPNKFMGTSGNTPSKIPVTYNDNMLVQGIQQGKYNFFIYGKDFSDGRYLLITDSTNSKTLHLLDFSSYSMTPDYIKEDIMFINQEIRWANIQDNILYISHAHSTYASSSKNMNAYITAIDLSSYKVLWRSAPLVCNSSNFEVYGDVIICGYGFTNEPDFLYTLNRHTGAVIEKIPVKTGPELIIRKADKVYVRTYNTDYIFKAQ